MVTASFNEQIPSLSSCIHYTKSHLSQQFNHIFNCAQYSKSALHELISNCKEVFFRMQHSDSKAVGLKSTAGGEKTDFTADTMVETTMGSKGTTTTLTHALSSTSSTPLTQEQRLAEIKKNRGAITWNPGALHDGRRWDVILYPYEQKSDHLVLVSKRPPAGATVVNDAGSAFKTAKMLYGKAPNRNLLVSGMGFEQPAMLPETSSRIPLYYRPLSTDGKLTFGLKAALPSIERGWPPKLRAFPLRRINKLT